MENEGWIPVSVQVRSTEELLEIGRQAVEMALLLGLKGQPRRHEDEDWEWAKRKLQSNLKRK